MQTEGPCRRAVLVIRRASSFFLEDIRGRFVNTALRDLTSECHRVDLVPLENKVIFQAMQCLHTPPSQLVSLPCFWNI